MKIEIDIPDAAFAKLEKLAGISRGGHDPLQRGALLLSRAITADYRIHFDPRRLEARKLKKITKLRAALESLGAPVDVDGEPMRPRPMAPESAVSVSERPLDAETLAELEAAAEEATADVKPPKGPAKPKAKTAKVKKKAA